MPPQLFLGLKERLTHFDEGLCIVRSGNHAAVVIAQDDYRRLCKVRSEHAFAARIKRVAVDEGKHLVIAHDRARYSGLRPR